MCETHQLSRWPSGLSDYLNNNNNNNNNVHFCSAQIRLNAHGAWAQLHYKEAKIKYSTETQDNIIGTNDHKQCS